MAALGYVLLKWIHVLLAITAVGANITYGIWIARSTKGDAKYHAQVLRTIKFLDDRVANPCYGLLLLTGGAMVALSRSGGTGGWSFTTPWILASLVLYVVAVVLGLFMYSPALRRQIAAAETAGTDSADYKISAAQSRQLGIISAVIVVAITFLMVVKPTFGLAVSRLSRPAGVVASGRDCHSG